MIKLRKSICLCVLVLIAILMIIPSISAFAEQTKEVEWLEIVWEQDGYEETDLPNGLIGYSYPVPKHTVYDNNGNIVNVIETFVYAPNGNLVAVSNGRFLTDTVGEYVITYKGTYKDISCEKHIKVEVKDSCDEFKYQINSKIKEQYYTGETVILYDGTIFGGLGDVAVNVSVIVNGNECEVYDFGGHKYFTPKTSGVYELKYTLKDFVNAECIEQKTITVTDSLYPLMEEVPLSKKVRLGEKVSFPVVDARLYKDGKSYLVPVNVYVNDVDVSNAMEYTFSTEGNYIVRYVATNIFDSSKSTQYSYSVDVVNHLNWDLYNGTYHYMENFIYNENCTRVFKDGILIMQANDGVDNCSFAWAKKIKEQFISFDLNVIQEKSEFESLNIKFVDSRNATETVKISLIRDAGGKKTDVYLNEEYSYKLNYSFDSENIDIKSIIWQLDTKSGMVVDNLKNKLFAVKTYENGKKFRGFTSGNAYMIVEMDGVYGDAAIAVNGIANVTITDMDMDGTIPQRIENDMFNSTIIADINQDIVLPYLTFFDLCDDQIELVLSITDPDGQNAFLGKITEDKIFTPTKYGSYSVRYASKDASGNANSIYCTIMVVDRIAPTIKVSSIKSTIGVGETLELPKPEVLDNNTKKCSSYICIISEQYQIDYIYNYSYTFKNVGDYVIRYVVHDDNMNTVYVEFEISCR